MARATRKSSKKLDRKELKGPDLFQSRGERILEWIIEHKRQILAVCVGLVVLFLAVSALRYYLESRHAAVSLRFARALKTLDAPIVEEGETPPEGTDEYYTSEEFRSSAALEKFSELVSEHQGTGLGTMARFYQANLQFELKRYDKAAEGYRTFLDEASGDFDDVRFLAEFNLGQTYEATNQPAEAEKQYRKLFEDEGSIWKEQAGYHLARMLHKLGKTEEAISTMKKMLEDFPESTLKTNAEKLIDFWQSSQKGSQMAPDTEKAEKVEPKNEEKEVKQPE